MWGVRVCVCVHEHVAAEGGDSESRKDLQMSVWVWMATLTHAYVAPVLWSLLHGVHFAVQHLYFSATWFQTWKSCIWCWKLSSHQTAYFKTQHLMPEVWKKYFSSSTCIPKAGEVFLNLTGEHKSWTEDDSIVRVTYLTFQNVFGNDPWHFSHKTVSINIVCLKKGLNLQWQGYLLRKVKFNKYK